MSKRNEKRDFIIEKARETFLEKGLFNTVMDDIADRVGVTRRTLYRYFETKEELAYETTIVMLKEWNDYQKALFQRLEGSGIRRLEYFLNHLISYMSVRLDVMRYFGEFDFYFNDNGYTELSVACKSSYKSEIFESDTLLTEIINIGQNDKSIKQDINVTLMVATISHLLWGFGQRIASRGNTIENETGYRGIDIMKYQISLYIMAMEV